MNMTRAQQIRFVKDLAENLALRLTNAIEAGKIPAEWDGFELRQLLAEYADEATARMDRRRLREYRNTVLVNDL